MNPIDQHARTQVLLTRIAFERVEMGRDLARLQQATRVPALLRAVLGGGASRTALGAAGRDGGWLTLALTLLRRYRGAAVLLGSLAPALRVVKGWRRIALLVGIGTADWVGWRALSRRRDP